MEESNDKLRISQAKNYDIQLRDFENGLVNFLSQHNLPSDGIFVNVPERLNVFKNLDSVIEQIDIKEKEQSLYLSKFIAAVASRLV
jgi:hypothetical protein